ncbi:penicillin acylase family protein [Planomonospora sp. ID82291]|uniref:penicillin acylase family protein n=1 Tax=Planomonospora sp. ID82291 TaxID=2738136 RepID=UPI0027DAE70C|nr:penicillin acylase family protein [Planomonospora sp. ID82291]
MIPDGTRPEAGPEPPGPGTVPGRRGGLGRRLRRVARWTGAVVAVLALVASGLAVWSVRRGFPQHDGRSPLPGLSAPVTVFRDAYGVPQVYAGSAADLFRAQGYVTAQDRFWEMDYRRHLTSGRLAELFGPSLVPTDAFLRTLGWRRTAEREWRRISPEARSHLRAYADGVNAWIAANGAAAASGAKSLEYTVLGLQNPGYTVEPWDPVDSLAWLKAMAWELLGNMDAEIDRSLLLAQGLSRSQIEQLYPPYPYAQNHPIVDVPGPAPARPVPDDVWREAAPALGALRSLPLRTGGDTAGIGSNSWVVSGSLTASGKPMLAGDPHLAASLPGTWYQIGLRCTCSYNVQGLTMPGLPGVVAGRNERIAWGLTNLPADVTDLYLEKVEGERYFDGKAWRPLESRQEVIEVAGGRPVTITVRATGHGPLLSDRRADMLGVAARPPLDPAGGAVQSAAPGPLPSLDPGEPGVPAPAAAERYAVALRWTAFEPGRTMDALFGINKAANWTEFRAAAALFDEPAQNLVYADVDGHIGYQAPGRVPVRGKGDGAWPVPGWDPSYEWTGFIPFAELPTLFDPPGGAIVTANQAVAGPSYPHVITTDWTYGYRGRRVLDLIAERSARGGLGVADMRRMQFDNRNGGAPAVVGALLAVPLGDSAAAVARDLLKGWDFQQGTESAAAAFYNATWRHLLARTFDELPGDRKPGGGDRWWEVMAALLASPGSPWWDDRRTGRRESMTDILTAAMEEATAELTERLGDDPAAWRWGDLHTLTLKGDGPGRSGIAPVEWLFNRGPVPIAGGGDAVNSTSWSAAGGYDDVVFVPTMRMIVDMADPDGSRWVQLAGNSGHAFHPNFDDQLDLWRTGRDIPMQWTRQRIEATAENVLVLVPTGKG